MEAVTIFQKYDRVCRYCEQSDYRIFASGLRWWRCKCNQCDGQWFTYGEQPPIPVNTLIVQMPLLSNGEIVLGAKRMNNYGINPSVYEWLQLKGYTRDKAQTNKRLLLEIVVDADEIDIHSAKWYDTDYEDSEQLEYSSAGWIADYDNDPDTVETIEIDSLSNTLYELIEEWKDYS